MITHNYTKTTFVNGRAPAISATELNKIGSGIEEALNNADEINTSLSTVIEEVADVVDSVDGLTEDVASIEQSLGTDGTIKSLIDTAQSTALNAKSIAESHAGRHASNGADPITPASIGAASASHTHTMNDIASGTLPIGKGGTGATTASQARVNLGAAAADHTHTFAGITSGVLILRDTANYGTGNPPASAVQGQLYFKLLD